MGLLLAGLAVLVAVLVAVLGLACNDGGPAGEESLETVDVEPALELDTSEDQKAPERRDELVGRLPGDFPADLPLFLPASLVDFGDAPGGVMVDGVTVTLLTPRPLPEVRRRLLEKLRAAGWSVAPGEEGSYELHRDGRRARLEIANANPGTAYRYVY